MNGISETEKLYICYSGKVRAVIERYDVLISELRCERDSLVNYHDKAKSERNSTYLMVIAITVIILLLVVGAIYINLFYPGKIADVGTAIMILIGTPLFGIPFFLVIFKYRKSRKKYRALADKDKKESKSDGYVNSYEYKVERYTKCIIILEKRRNIYKKILEKMEKGEPVSEEEVYKMDHMTRDIYNVPEYGYTYNEFR
ncbi:MAG: hypothetical protein ACI39R_07450 [Lachnospiraceae bacterium]